MTRSVPPRARVIGTLCRRTCTVVSSWRPTPIEDLAAPARSVREQAERVSGGAIGGLVPRVVCANILCAAYPVVPCPRLSRGGAATERFRS